MLRGILVALTQFLLVPWLALFAWVGETLLPGREITALSGIAWGRAAAFVGNVKFLISGHEQWWGTRPAVVVANHTSAFDILAVMALAPSPYRFVAKKELLKIPVFGWALGISGHIVIDRGDPQSAIARINAAAEHTERGMGILFYAEGTRSRDGKVHEFKKGGVSLALSTQLPVVPMSVSGTRKFLPRSCAVIRPGGRVRIVLGEPIPTTGLTYDDREALNQRVRRVVVSNFVEELV